MTGHDRFFVITGGPGAGKTSLLQALAASGHACMPEAGRAVIRDQQAIGGPALPWADPPAFAAQMLGWELRSHRLAADLPGPVFFDRGLPDLVGYLALEGCPVPPHVEAAARLFRYNPTVFLAPHWPQIYVRDAERRQDPAEAEATMRMMARTYPAFGYRLVTLPRTDIAARARFVLETIAAD
ncbi:AAA family ATPase [Marinibaculum pumilum]|uniref:AAA family ATPase n=1 Tax=Marinibaculum pumilum TaxID=1766165 RepID=A0ABV7L7K9_9PROT